MNLKTELSLDTGDIVLFKGNGYLSRVLEYIGRSDYSHVGIVLKNPRFIPHLEDGLYLLESGYNAIPDSENNKLKYGVQIHLLEDILKTCDKGTVFVRRITCNRDEAFYEKWKSIHSDIHDKPYDINPLDWIEAEYNLFCPFRISSRFQKIDKFWCSALVTYILHALDLVEDVNWSLVAPREFGKGGSLKWKCEISDDESIY